MKNPFSNTVELYCSSSPTVFKYYMSLEEGSFLKNKDGHDSHSGLQRKLQGRHIHMIAIGGTIGTGIFVAMGGSFSQAGPGGTLLAYACIGMMVYFLMMSLGEMSTFMPVAGSFETYASKFIDPAVGFALGWNYWINWSVTLASELVAAAIILKFWLPNSSSFLWSAIFLTVLVFLNIMSSNIYGESEFWFAGIKVVTIIVFLILGVLIITGIIGGQSVGFENWYLEDAPFVGGFPATFAVFMIAGYSFMGTEVVGVTAGEAKDPCTAVPKAIKSVFWRIMLFYIGTIIVVGFIMPYNDPELLKSGIESISVSPFTLVFKRSGMALAAALMNTVILTAVLSCGNTGLYAGSRMLYAMAREGKAPHFFAKTNKKGVPHYAVYFTALVGMLAFLTSFAGTGRVYVWLIDGAGLTSFLAWFGIAVSHYRFRKAYIAQGNRLEDLKFKSKYFPVGPIIGMSLCALIIIGQSYFALKGEQIDWMGLFVSYISIPIFLLLILGYKLKYRTKLISYKDIEFTHNS